MSMANILACLIVGTLALQGLLHYLGRNASSTLMLFVVFIGLSYGIIAVAMLIGFCSKNIRSHWKLWMFGICVAVGFAIWNLRFFHSMSSAV